MLYMNNKKKIVVLHYSLSMGGTEKVLINMLNSLDYSRVEVTLWLLESGGILENDLTKEVKIKYFDYNKCFPENSWIRLIKHNIKQFNLMAVLRILLYLLLCIFVRKPELKYYFNLKKYGLFDKKCYDLLIDYTSYRQDLLYWGLTCFKAKKHVTWLHGKDSLKPEHDMRRYAYNRYDCIFSVSKGIKEYFLALYPELKDKVEVFYNIQDIDGII